MSRFHFLKSAFLIFRVKPSPHFLHSVLSDLVWSVSDLIAMCTADKTKGIGVGRKHLHCTTNSLAREINQQITNRQARKGENLTELKLFLK